MKPDELRYDSLNATHLKPYEKRGPTVSIRFQKWFLENIFRVEPIQADDATIDKQHDKGVDGILVDDVQEQVFIIQSKVKQKAKGTLGDTDLKEFYGTLEQFRSTSSIEKLLEGNASSELKKLIEREEIVKKIESGYELKGVFCTNICRNSDAEQFLENISDIILYDANKIAEDHVDLEAKTGIKSQFTFNVSDTDVLSYSTSQGYQTRIFLATALNLVHFEGIDDQTLFSQNVRFALGNTKVNKALKTSIQDRSEHTNFPLYHNGITVLCGNIEGESDDGIIIKNYQVVNGAQSLTSLKALKSKLTDDLKILVKVIELGENQALSDKITHNSNNQNAIKGRDLKSNNPIQERLAKEVKSISNGKLVYEVKQGEDNSGKTVVSNEVAGLIILAMDIGEPWSCHQKYKVMESSHAKIFGRIGVDGAKIISLVDCFDASLNSLDSFDDQGFGYYSLTKYFLAYATSEIIKDCDAGKVIFSDFGKLIENDNLTSFVEIFANISSTTADDLNAEILDEDSDSFDYKKSLKSPTWCRSTAKSLVAQYRKDVKRQKAENLQELLEPLIA